MNEMEREHLLHRWVAGSAFLFALLILPVAQYLIVGGLQPEEGQVAGVSTEESVTRQNFASPAECESDKQLKLYELEQWENGKKQAMLRDFEAVVAPYRAARTVVQGTPEQIASEQAALDQLIDTEYQPYLAKLAEVETAVGNQRQELVSRNCTTQ